MTAPTNGFSTLHKSTTQHTLLSDDDRHRVRAIRPTSGDGNWVFIQNRVWLPNDEYRWTIIALHEGVVTAIGYGPTRDIANVACHQQLDALGIR